MLGVGFGAYSQEQVKDTTGDPILEQNE